MSVTAGQVVTAQFPIYDRNGNGCDFDVSPTPAAKLVANGVDLVTAVSIDSVGEVDAANGKHTVSFTVPATGLVAGDRLQVRVTAGADGASGPGFVWGDIVDDLVANVPTVSEVAAGLTGQTINILGSLYSSGDINIVQGDDYTGDFAINLTLPATAPDLTGATLAYILDSGVAVSVAATCSNPGTAAQLVPLVPTKTDTAALTPGARGQYQLQATYPGSLPRTIAEGNLIVSRKLAVSA